MVRVIAVSNPRLAQAFVDYMATQGIELRVHNSGEAAEIWLADDSHLEQVQHELQQFLIDPLNSRYRAASWQAGKTDAELHYQGYSYLQTLRSKAGPLTLSVMALCIVVYILMQAVLAAEQRAVHATVALGQPCFPAFLAAAHHL